MIKPSPPIPDIIGSTTFKTAAVAMAASTAFPPFCSMDIPAWEASGWPEQTIPFLPMTTGLCDVKRTPCGEAGINGLLKINNWIMILSVNTVNNVDKIKGPTRGPLISLDCCSNDRRSHHRRIRSHRRCRRNHHRRRNHRRRIRNHRR